VSDEISRTSSVNRKVTENGEESKTQLKEHVQTNKPATNRLKHILHAATRSAAVCDEVWT